LIVHTMYRARILVVVYMLIHFVTYLFKTFALSFSGQLLN